MADAKISQLPVATTPLAGTELVPLVQGGVTVQSTVDKVLTGTVPSGTANGVLFLNGSKVVTSGSALTFDGTNLSTTGSVASTNATTGFVTDASNGFALFSGSPSDYNISRSGTNVSVKSGGDVSLISGSVSPIIFRAFGSEQMRLTSTGLGIGNTSPVNTLDVLTSSVQMARFIGPEYAQVQFSDGTRAAFIQVFDNQARLFTSTNTLLAFGTNDTERARIPAAGGMVVGTAALTTTATDGFLYVPTCAGTPTGTPTTQTGTAPIVIDTTNHKLYFYSGGTWRDAGP